MRTLQLCALTLAAVGAPAAGWAQDSDGDGALDSGDRFPCDASAAAEVFAPAEGVHGQLVFEDQWPSQGDLDFNDAVVTYNYALLQDASGAPVHLRITYNILAIGGRFVNGLGLQLPLPSADVASVERTIGAGAPVALVPSATDGDFTVTLLDDMRTLFGGQLDQINSVPGQPTVTGETMVIDIDFAPGASLSVAEAPHDLFIFRTEDPTHEIHRPEYSGTSRMDAALFGTMHDGSTVDRSFVDFDGLPFALVLPEATAYPAEATPITALFPDIVDFAASAGAASTDFYASTVVSASAYGEPGAPTPAFLTPTNYPSDGSCLPNRSCADLYGAGHTATGNYTIDPDGVGGTPARQVYCDMSNGGGWTRVIHWDRINNGDTLADYRAIMTTEWDNMGRFEEASNQLRWNDRNSNADSFGHYADIDVPNGGEVRLKVYYYGYSMENSGIYFFVRTQAGVDENLYCRGVLANALKYYTAQEQLMLPYTCAQSASGSFTVDTTFERALTSPVAQFRIHSGHHDNGTGDYSRLYRFEVLVR